MAVAILTTDLTTGALDGTGVFDQLMRSVKPHIKAEYDSGRIKGAEYSQVYLAAVNSAMSQSIEFLLKQDATKAQNEILEQQKLQLVAETASAVAQTALLTEQKSLVSKDILQRTQETLTEVENTLVATAAKCKLQGEFDLIVQQKLKAIQETAILTQKVVTETAQTNGASVSANSVIGSQVALYSAQKDGFIRDAEQKAAKLFFDTWNVRRTTDSTVAATTGVGGNNLTDADIGAVATKLKTGIGVT